MYGWDGLLSANRAAERIGGRGRAQGKYKKWGPKILIVGRGSGGPPPGNFEILHTLKCVLGTPEALLVQHIVHYT